MSTQYLNQELEQSYHQLVEFLALVLDGQLQLQLYTNLINNLLKSYTFWKTKKHKIYTLFEAFGPRIQYLSCRCTISHQVWECYSQVIRGAVTVFPCIQWHFKHSIHTSWSCTDTLKRDFLKSSTKIKYSENNLKLCSFSTVVSVQIDTYTYTHTNTQTGIIQWCSPKIFSEVTVKP